jgi:NADPH:quinone reductase-like Zn-dependent oxidoreductase
MKAAYTRYGPPDVVEVNDLDKPVPSSNEVLIKVHAASVNPLDWKTMTAGPYIVRLLLGLRKPKIKPLGVDLAGQVEAVGGNVTQFKPGDAVFGTCRGAFAEYACTRESERIMKSALVMKPQNLTFEQAACVPIAGLTALQGLRDKGRIQPGQKVLINGAAGGVGTFAVQIAKSFGANVTAVCSTRNVDMVRSIGADRVIDYIREDFTSSGQRYDIFFDAVGNHSLPACRRVLSPQGILIMVGVPSDARLIATMARLIGAPVLSLVVSQKLVFFLAKSNREDLTTLGNLIASGKVTPVVDRRFSLSEVPDALRYLKEGHARGKVAIILEQPNNET